MIRVVFSVCLFCFSASFLRADTISGTWAESSPSGFPGTPLSSYTWTGDSPFGSDPFDDPFFARLGQTPGSFLFTANTYYNFTGTPEITIWYTSPGSHSLGNYVVKSNVTSLKTAVSAVPEPDVLWLAGTGLAGILVYGLGRKRSVSDAQPGVDSDQVRHT